jgi:hypothetical protein
MKGRIREAFRLVAVCAHNSRLNFFVDRFTDIGGAGATFVMEAFRLYFGWDCPEGDEACVPASQSKIDTDQGLINGLFGAGAAM